MDMNEKCCGLRARVVSKLRVVTAAVALGIAALVSLNIEALTTPPLGEGRITEVAVSGGADTVNPGTTCIKVDFPIAASCTLGYVAIPNNNSKLVNAALASKASNGRMVLYYVTDGPDQHCPALVFTKCGVISIIVR